ncbi:MAG: SpoIIE family protein phosphatase [Clostridia bacterium]|nr:SpoIIE family protein phosphatase [Clostridia bacterium]
MKEKCKALSSRLKPAAAWLQKAWKRAASFLQAAWKRAGILLAPVRSWFRKTWKYIVPFLTAAIVLLLIAVGTLHRLDRWTQDAIYQQRGVPSSDIIIIEIDDKTLEYLGPYSGTNYRSWLAMALFRMASDPEHLPAAVAIDILFESNDKESNNDRMLAAYAERLGCVVTAVSVEYGDIIEWGEDGHAVSRRTGVVNDTRPFEALQACTTQGHINAMPDKDGILRHALLYVESGEDHFDSMAVETARKYLESKGQELQLPDVSATAGHFYVSFTGRPGDFSNHYSLYRLIDPRYWADDPDSVDWQPIPAEAWAGKIVLIGPYAASLGDAYFTSASKAEPMYGVEYQANVIQSLLEGNLKTEVSDLIQLLVVGAICFTVAWFFFHRKIWIGALIFLGLVVFGFGAAYILYLLGLVVHVLWLPVAALVLFLAGMVWHYVQAAKERRALALEKERIATELALATRIQANYLPKVFPESKQFDLYASMTPAKEVGGDLYDFFLIDDDHLCLVIGDVSGKGVPASLFMMLASALIHHVAMHETSPAKILTEVNAEICSRNPEEMFVTVWLGVLQLSTGTLVTANAGHEYPAVKPPNDHFDLIKDRHGFVVGGMEGIRYREFTIQMEPGTKVFVYTDGVPEATNATEEMFGKDRLTEALRAHEDDKPEVILDTVRQSIAAFVGDAQQFDDLTMLCVTYHGPQPQENPAE